MRRTAARKAMLDHDISQRRACGLVGLDPKTVRRDKPPEQTIDASTMAAMKFAKRCRQTASVRLSPDRCAVGTQTFKNTLGCVPLLFDHGFISPKYLVDDAYIVIKRWTTWRF